MAAVEAAVMVVFMAAVFTAAVFMVEASMVEVFMAVAFAAAASTVVSGAAASTPGAFTVAAFTTADIAIADSTATIIGGISMARLITTRITTIAGSSGPITARAASVTGTGGITGDTGNYG
jgi:hypothetical protein